MAQHDYDIANAAGAAFRGDLNNALLAAVTQNSGATAPATTYAYMPWADTTTGLLKIRNAANSAWITVGTLADAYLGLLPLSGGTLTGLLTFKKGADIASAATLNLSTATGNLLHITGTTATSAVTMNSGQVMLLIADAAWPLTYHATNNKINSGGVDKTLAAGDMVLYHSDGTTVRGYIIKADGTAVVAASTSVGNHEVTVTSGTGYGSTNTKIRRFTTALTNVGTAITYADSAANGASFTINETGLYAMCLVDGLTAGDSRIGISVNSTELTTNIQSIASANIVSWTHTAASSSSSTSRTMRLVATDVVRAHTQGDASSNTTAQTSRFSISKVST